MVMPNPVNTPPHKAPPGRDGLVEAIRRAGSGAELARKLGLTRFAIHQWKLSGVPAERVPAVSRITGVPLHELRPDLFDPPGSAKPGRRRRLHPDAIQAANDDARRRGDAATFAPVRHQRVPEAA